MNMITPDEATGRATAANATSQVIISNYFAITLGTNFSADGIDFGNLTALPAVDQNATLNYMPAGAESDVNYTGYNMSVSIDSNVNIDGCIKANDSLKSGSNLIGLPNYTWANMSTTNGANTFWSPAIANSTEITTSDVKSASGVAPGNDILYRFWLDVAVSTNPGTYTNTVELKAIKADDTC
ncbi:hypothetical protein ACFLQN_02835 [Candidatus Aenigmatarchaeota archaeon]